MTIETRTALVTRLKRLETACHAEATHYSNTEEAQRRWREQQQTVLDAIAALDAAPPSLPTFEQAELRMHLQVSQRELMVFACSGPIEHGTMAENAADAIKDALAALRQQPEPSLPTAQEVLEDDLIPRLRHVVSQCLSVRDVSRSDGWNHAWYENAQTIRDAIRRVALSSQEPPPPPPALIAHTLRAVMDEWDRRLGDGPDRSMTEHEVGFEAWLRDKTLTAEAERNPR